MRNQVRIKSFDMNPAGQCSAEASWPALDENASSQALRNTGRIEQLEASHETLKAQLAELMEQVPPKFGKSLQVGERWDISEKAIKAFASYVFTVSWGRSRPRREIAHTVVATVTSSHLDRLNKIEKLLGDLADDFEDIPRRIVQAALLEKELAGLEEALDDNESEHFAWCVSLLRDVLDYNYAEDFTRDHLKLMQKGVSIVCVKAGDCTKSDYQALHESFLKAGLYLIPVTARAIEKYGE